MDVSNYGRSRTLREYSTGRREAREGRVWLILEVAALLLHRGGSRRTEEAGGYLVVLLQLALRAIRHWHRAFRRRSKMGHAQSGLGSRRSLVWLLIGNSDVGGLSLASLSVPHVILDARANIFLHLCSGIKAVARTRAKYGRASSPTVSRGS